MADGVYGRGRGVRLKLTPFEIAGARAGYLFYCVGCKSAHPIYVEQANPRNGARWSFDGNIEAPTFLPSLNLPGACHMWIKAGRLEYLSDCSHALAGQTVDMQQFRWDETEEPE